MTGSRWPAYPGCPVPRASRALLLRAVVAFVAGGLVCAAPAAARGPVGYWFTEDLGGIVQIQPCGGDILCGTIIGLRDWPASGKRLDWRGNPQCGFALLRNLRPQDDGRWHGTVTNPEDGQTYTAEVWVPEDGILRLRGYIGLPILGSTQRWRPSPTGARPDCHYLR